MKRRLNILCVVVVLILLYPVLEYGYYVGAGVRMGFEKGMEMGKEMGKGQKQNSKEHALEMLNIKTISLTPKNFEFTDSVYNAVSGQKVPVIYGQMVVNVPVKSQTWIFIAEKLLPMLALFASLAALVVFFLLISSVNKLDIFTWKNVSRLRWIGSLLIVSYLGMLIPVLLQGYELSGVFSVEGYSLNQSDLASFMTLVLGIVSYIVAEIIAIGLRIKEEQDLTI